MDYDYFPSVGDRYTPSYGASVKTTANVIVNNFGDGYEQRIPHGKNHIKETISLTWNNIEWDYRTSPEKYKDGNIIYHFLFDRLQVKPFWFRLTPNSEYKLYICDEVSYSQVYYHRVNISATFTEYRGL